MPPAAIILFQAWINMKTSVSLNTVLEPKKQPRKNLSKRSKLLKVLFFCLFTVSISGDNPCDFLKPLLGKSFENGADPYDGIYQHNNPSVRYVEQVRAIASRCYLVDNLRVMGTGDDPIHKPGWSSQLVDTNKLKRVYLMANDFPVRIQNHSFNAGHFQMLFEFHPVTI